MSLTLTAPSRTSVIDLTLTPDTPTSTPSSPFKHPTPLRRPRATTGEDTNTPRKRIKTDSQSPPRPPRRDWKQSLAAQVVPLVKEVTASQSRAELKVNEIGTQLKVDETYGYLSQADLQQLRATAQHGVAYYSGLPEYRIERPSNQNPIVQQPAPTSEPTPARLPSTPAQSTPGPKPVALYKETSVPAPLQRRERSDRPFEPLVRRQKTTAQSDKLSLNIQKRRPYCSAAERREIHNGARSLSKRPKRKLVKVPLVYHVDFSDAEVADIVSQVNLSLQQSFPHTREALRNIIRNPDLHLPSWISRFPSGRTEEDVRQFCSDLLKEREGLSSSAHNVLSMQRPPVSNHPQDTFGTRASSLLLARESEGNAGFGRMRRHVNFQKDLARMREDGLDLVAEYTGCSGDLDTFAWVSNEAFVCGATSHSDTFNQQYNKPGNLLLCSTVGGTLTAYPDHRTERPLIQKGENSSEAMRRSQSPWIYHSVVASDYDPILKLAYTASFDKTVKVWRVGNDGHHMECLATWDHAGIVNFVQCAKDGSGRVATASNCIDKPAVRIYTVDPDNVALIPDQELSCQRRDHLAEDGSRWAYYPATMQWGKGPQVQHLLAVGYSPRADSGHDSDIPEDKEHTGEIMLWDAVERMRIDISNATTANVFEIVWHPTLARFACATTRCGKSLSKPGTRTQVHIFKKDLDPSRPNSYFSSVSLDCPACDINEVTYMPNSLENAYVTAACTDGRVYVWDTAFDNDLLYVLKHGESLETFDIEVERRETMDTGVKFTAWGTTLDRFYTGGSDGVVNIWNLQDKQKPFVRKLLPKTGAPISGGAFSPDMQKLAIGDATGRVWLFSVDRRDECDSHYRTDRLRPHLGRYRGSVAMIPHAEPPLPPRHEGPEYMDVVEIKDSNDTTATPPTCISEESEDDDDDVAVYCRKQWLDTQRLAHSGELLIGMVQGPNYMASSTFKLEAHVDNDPSKPLTWEYQKIQQSELLSNSPTRDTRLPKVHRTSTPDPLSRRLEELHVENKEQDEFMLELYETECRRQGRRYGPEDLYQADIIGSPASGRGSEDED